MWLAFLGVSAALLATVNFDAGWLALCLYWSSGCANNAVWPPMLHLLACSLFSLCWMPDFAGCLPAGYNDSAGWLAGYGGKFF
jgi:hypothetical protein